MSVSELYFVYLRVCVFAARTSWLPEEDEENDPTWVAGWPRTTRCWLASCRRTRWSLSIIEK